MGKLFDILQRTSEPVNPKPTTNPLKLARPVEDSLAPLAREPEADWPDWEASAGAPFVEVPDTTELGQPAEVAPSVVPFRAEPRKPASSTPRISEPPVRPADDSYRKIAQHILRELGDRQAESLLLIPLEESDQFGHALVELSHALAAELKQPLLLIDTSRPSSAVRERMGVAAGPGWEELLLGLNQAHAIQRSRITGVDVVLAGNRLAEATPSRWASEATQCLRRLRSHYALTLLASPSWPASPLGLLLAAEVPAVCPAVSPTEADGRLHQQLLQSLEANQRPILGSLILG